MCVPCAYEEGTDRPSAHKRGKDSPENNGRLTRGRYKFGRQCQNSASDRNCQGADPVCNLNITAVRQSKAKDQSTKVDATLSPDNPNAAIRVNPNPPNKELTIQPLKVNMDYSNQNPVKGQNEPFNCQANVIEGSTDPTPNVNTSCPLESCSLQRADQGFSVLQISVDSFRRLCSPKTGTNILLMSSHCPRKRR